MIQHLFMALITHSLTRLLCILSSNHELPNQKYTPCIHALNIICCAQLIKLRSLKLLNIDSKLAFICLFHCQRNQSPVTKKHNYISNISGKCSIFQIIPKNSGICLPQSYTWQFRCPDLQVSLQNKLPGMLFQSPTIAPRLQVARQIYYIYALSWKSAVVLPWYSLLIATAINLLYLMSIYYYVGMELPSNTEMRVPEGSTLGLSCETSLYLMLCCVQGLVFSTKIYVTITIVQCLRIVNKKACMCQQSDNIYMLRMSISLPSTLMIRSYSIRIFHKCKNSSCMSMRNFCLPDLHFVSLGCGFETTV